MARDNGSVDRLGRVVGGRTSEMVTLMRLSFPEPDWELTAIFHLESAVVKDLPIGNPASRKVDVSGAISSSFEAFASRVVLAV